MLTALAYAAGGGFLWGFGSLGKRLGVQGSRNHDKTVRASITIFVYMLTTLIAPLVDFLATDRALTRAALTDPEWTRRAPGIVSCGLISGLGGLLGTIAFAWSAGVSSALISMVENGSYTLAGAVIIAIWFQEHPTPLQWAAGSVIIFGIVLAQSSTGRPKGLASQTRAEPDSESEGSDSEGEEDAVDKASSTASSDSCSSEASDSKIAPAGLRKRAVVFAVLAGTCWGFGPAGKQYGVHGAPVDSKHVWTTCTYLVYIFATIWVPIAKLVFFTDRQLVREVLRSRTFRRLLLGVFGCGLLSGVGGLLSTLAFANATHNSALLSVVENGVYTVFGALLITVCFKEWPTKRQLVSAALVLCGLLLSALGKSK